MMRGNKIKSKKGMMGLFAGIIIILVVISQIIYYFAITEPTNEPSCKENFKMYDLDECINQLENIKQCHKINATWIKTKVNLFSSNEISCYKDGEVIRI
jgi:hypothetical protein